MSWIMKANVLDYQFVEVYSADQVVENLFHVWYKWEVVK